MNRKITNQEKGPTILADTSDGIGNVENVVGGKSRVRYDLSTKKENSLLFERLREIPSENNPKVKIVIAMTVLLEEASDFKKSLDVILGQRNIVLQINNIKELSQFTEALLNSTLSQDCEFILKQINTLDFSKFDVDYNNQIIFQNILEKISQLELFDELKTLKFGDIKYGKYILTFPTISQLTKIEFQNIYNDLNITKLINLETFLCGDIYSELMTFSGLQLSNLPELKTVSFKDIYVGLIISDLPKLTKLSLQNIGGNATVKLFNSLENLEILEIGNIGCQMSRQIHVSTSNTSVQLCASFDNLRSLSIGNVNLLGKTSVELAESFDNLETFTVGNISCFDSKKANIKLLCKLNELKSFSISKLSYFSPSLFSSFHRLENLEIQSVQDGGELNFSFDTLKHLTIRRISASNFTLTDAFKNLETLTLGKGCSQLLISVANLKSLFINNIDSKVTLSMHEHNNLERLIIGDIEYLSSFNLQGSYKNLQYLKFGSVRANTSVKLPVSLDNLITLSLDTIYTDAVLELPNSISHLSSIECREDRRGLQNRLPLLLLKCKFEIYNNKLSILLLLSLILITLLSRVV